MRQMKVKEQNRRPQTACMMGNWRELRTLYVQSATAALDNNEASLDEYNLIFYTSLNTDGKKKKRQIW